MGYIDEAFRAGKSFDVIQKMINVISKKIGQKIVLSDFPFDYENEYGIFIGYYAAIGSGERLLRINFQVNGHDQIVSIDLYNDSYSYEPDLTIDIKGLNVIQVIDQIINVIEGKSIEEKVIKERGAVKGGVEVEVKRGSSERAVSSKEDEKAENDIVDIELSAEEQFEALEQYVKLAANKTINSLYVYGGPGTGKTKVVTDTLNDTNVKWVSLSGAVKGVAELVRMLYVYREGFTIVLDDFDSAMKSKEMANILKAALQDEPERTIVYLSNKSIGGKRKHDIPEHFKFLSSVIFISNIEKIDPAIKSRSMVVEINLSNKDILKRIKDVLEDYMPNIDMDTKIKVYSFLYSNRAKVKRIDFRQFKNCVIIATITPQWKKRAMAMLSS